ncbi:hypothetical protein [Winogradskya consettensis]|nr:hypothetical protein [Actinoplanes consettensis]
MSRITDMVLYVGSDLEDEAIGRLNAWCAKNDQSRRQQFVELDTDLAGGTKFSARQVWAMTGNFFPYEDLVEALPSFGWRHPEDVVLVVDDDEDYDGVKVHRPT